MSGKIDRDSFVMHQSFLDGFATMNKTQICTAIQVISDYAMHGVEPKIDDPLIQMWFNMAKYTVDHDTEKYLKKVEGGRKGGLAKSSNLSNLKHAKQPKQPKACLAKPSMLSVNVNDNVNVNVNDNVNVKELSTTNVVEAAPEEFGKAEINSFIDEFESKLKIPVNRSKKSERFAANRLIRKHGFEQACKLIRMAEAAQMDRYAPRVGSICDLDSKQGELVVWGRQKVSSSNNSSSEVVIL